MSAIRQKYCQHKDDLPEMERIFDVRKKDTGEKEQESISISFSSLSTFW